MTVTREDVTRHPSGLRAPGPVTTAHHHIARFYLAAERQHRTWRAWLAVAIVAATFRGHRYVRVEKS